MLKQQLLIAVLCLVGIAGLPSDALADHHGEHTHPDGLFFGGAIGGAFNALTNLQFRQEGESDVNVFADYSNKPFEDYPYWTLRFENWESDRALEFEVIHHKIYLENTPDEVAYYNVSDGYNMFMVNRARRIGSRIWRFGGGMVIGHPESRVRGQEHESSGGFGNAGFYLGGPAIQAGVEWRRFVSEVTFISFEQKLTAAYTDFPIENGTASGFNFAWHLTLRWGTRKPDKGASLKEQAFFWSPLAMPFVLDAVFPSYIDKP